MKPFRDYLYPVGRNQNRNEYLLVEFDDILKTSFESVLYGLLQLPDEIRDKFPGLEQFAVIDPVKTFETYCLWDAEAFLRGLLGDDTLDQEEFRDILDRAFKEDTLRLQTDTMMLYALINIAAQKYTKRVTIVNRRKLEPFELAYLRNAFDLDWRKVSVLHGSVASVLLESDVYTTVAMTDPSELLEMLQDQAKYHLDNTLVLLQNNVRDCEVSINDDGVVKFEESLNDEIFKLTDDTLCQVARFKSERFIKPINMPD